MWPANPKALSPIWTVSGVTGTALNVAVTVIDEASTTVHGFPAAHAPALVQPPNIEFGSGLAVKTTLGGLVGSVRGYWPVHSAGWRQVRPTAVTVPPPLPASLTVRVT